MEEKSNEQTVSICSVCAYMGACVRACVCEAA